MIKQLIKSITKKEWLLVMALAVFVIIITTAPYIYGWLMTPAGHSYTGLHSLTPGDVHVYFSWMEQVKQGNFISVDLYTSEPQARVILNSFWSVMGLIAKWSGLSNIMVFQLARIILIPVFMAVLYLVASYFWQDKVWRKICFTFLTFASGLGLIITGIIDQSVYSQIWYNWPLDLWAPENNNLLTMFQSPHLILSTMLMILVLFLSFLSLEKNKIKYSLWAGILALILFQFHPFHVPTIFGVLGVYALIKFIINKKINYNYIKHLSILFILSLPSILYWFLLSKYDFVTQIRSYQNICLSPVWWVTLFSYGFILVLAIFAVYKIVRQRQFSNINIFLIVWLVVHFSLLYSPFNFQRRLMQGLQIPMILLAVMGLYFIYQYLRKKMDHKKFEFWVNNKYLLIIIFILLFTSSHIYNWIREISVFANIYPQLYIRDDHQAGYDWLAKNSAQDDVILTDLYNGNLIPGKIGRRVFIGHTVETLFYESKLNQMIWFYSTNSVDNRKQQFLEDNNINYVFYGSGEKDFGYFKPGQKEYLQIVFQDGQVEIYKFINK